MVVMISRSFLAKGCLISRTLIIITTIFICLIERISAESAPVKYPGVIDDLNGRGKRELIGDPAPSLSFADQGWFARFLLNFLGYSIILLPCALTVFMVKNKLCLPQVQSFLLVRLFVYGKEDERHEDDIEIQVNDPEDTKVHSDINSSSGINLVKVLQLAYCFFGLQISFLAWGLLQEKIMTTEYVVTSTSDTKSTTPTVIRFRDSQFLVLANRVLALVFSAIALIATRKGKRTSNSGYVNMTNSRIYLIAPLYEFIFCSLSNVLSSWCQYEALKYVNFPTQVLSKACKILPVMLMARLVSGKKFRPLEYLIAVSISLGMSLFLWGNHLSSLSTPSLLSKHQVNGSSANLIHASYTKPSHDGPISYSLFDGLIVLALYLTFDSFTSNWQERLSVKYKVSTAQMMAAVNCYSILLTATSLSQQGDLIPALKIVLSSSTLTMDCLILSLMSASGQLFIFYTISTFGAFIFTIIMTIRQSFAIILSCLIYGHSLNIISIIGILIVFVSLFSQIYFKSSNKK